MSIAQYFESGEKKQDKGHFKNLLLIAKADGKLTEEENTLLNRIGKNIGLSQEQINEIINNPSKYPVIPPISKIERMQQMVELIKMMIADGEIDKNEMNLLDIMAVRLGYKSIDDVDVKKAIEMLLNGDDTETIAEKIA